MSTADATTLQRLATLQSLAAQQEDHAARQLAEALARHANADDRHAELVRYEAEYAERAPAATGIQALSHQAGFLTKLRDAVRFQADRAVHCAGEVEQARARWIGLHREVEKIEQLSLNARRQIAANDDRRQARELDELAQRGWVRLQAAG